jgi:hypothetical protein
MKKWHIIMAFGSRQQHDALAAAWLVGVYFGDREEWCMCSISSLLQKLL